MKSILEQILYGEWGHIDTIKPSREAKEALNRLVHIDYAVKELLQDDPERLRAVQDLQDVFEEINSCETIDYYKAGFKNAFLLAAELFSPDWDDDGEN